MKKRKIKFENEGGKMMIQDEEIVVAALGVIFR